MCKYFPPGLAGVLLGCRHGQGIKSITWNINKSKMTLKTFCKPFLFKSIKRMDTVRDVQFLHHRVMIWISCLKPSLFCVNELSLYPRNVVKKFIKLIFFGGGIFLNNHNNVVFAWIFCMRKMMFFKMGNDVLTFL